MNTSSALVQIGTEPSPAVRLRQLWGRNITERRTMLGRTRAELAEACDVTEAAVGMWERGETTPRPHLQVAIAKFLQSQHSHVFPMVEPG